MADTASMGGGAAGNKPSPSMGESTRAAAGEPPRKGRWLVLVAMVFGLFMPMLDNLVVNVALPTMQRDLAARVSDLQWIIDAYTLTFASFMLIGGSLGDLFGRKKLFLAGLVLFTLGSLACGMAESTEQLVGFRAVQGLGSALLLPGSLSILTATFHGKERGTAIGVWAAMSGLAVAVGPLVGGYIVENYSWETIFFINVPVGILGFLLTTLVVRESRDTTRTRRLDLPGLITGTAGLFFLVYALIEGGSEGWTDELIVGSFGAAAVLLLLFIVVELRSKSPMLPLRFFRNPTFAASNAVAASVFFALFGTTFFLALYMQNVRGFSPLETGVRLMPFTAAMLLISPIAGRISDKHGSRWLMAIGSLYAAGGMALLLRIEPDSSYESIILPAFLVLGSGMALTMAPMTAAVMASVQPRHAGVASATTNTSRELGGVLGIALLGAVVTSAFKDRLLDNLATVGLGSSAAQSIVDQASRFAASGGGDVESFRRQVPPGTPELTISQVVSAAQGSFVDAIRVGLLVGVGCLLLASLLSAVFVRSHVGQEHAGEARAPQQPTEDDAVRRARKKMQTGAAEPEIDARTEEVLRQALEPSSVTNATQPIPTEAGEEAAASPPRRKLRAVPPVSVQDAHYHGQPDEIRTDEAWAPDQPEPASAVEAYQRLRALMVDLPMQAGTGEVAERLEEMASATLRYYRHALSDPQADALPVGITDGAQSSTREDIGIITGYLNLEKRFGRVDGSLQSQQAAGRLMTALASRALESNPGGGSDAEFVRAVVNECLHRRAPATVGAATPAASPDAGSGAKPDAGSGAKPDRLVYRRRGPGGQRT